MHRSPGWSGAMRKLGPRAAVVCALLLDGCTAAPEALNANDPFEPMNRAFFKVDEAFDKDVVLPAAGFYLDDLPVPLRKGFHDFVSNLALPVSFGNDLLQGNIRGAGETLGRFTLNSTAGLGGIADVATPAGLPEHLSDFGQTLAKYGMHEGPFLVLPIIGPEPPRDLVGDVVDLAMDPLTYVPPAWPFDDRIGIAAGVQVLNRFETHARNIFLRQALEKDSLDPYATMRSTYRQVRASEIADGKPISDESSGSDR